MIGLNTRWINISGRQKWKKNIGSTYIYLFYCCLNPLFSLTVLMDKANTFTLPSWILWKEKALYMFNMWWIFHTERQLVKRVINVQFATNHFQETNLRTITFWQFMKRRSLIKVFTKFECNMCGIWRIPYFLI